MRSPILSRGRSSSSPEVRRSSWEPSNEVARDQRHPSQPLPPAMTYHRPVDSVAGRMGSGRPSLEGLSWPLAGSSFDSHSPHLSNTLRFSMPFTTTHLHNAKRTRTGPSAGDPIRLLMKPLRERCPTVHQAGWSRASDVGFVGFRAFGKLISRPKPRSCVGFC